MTVSLTSSKKKKVKDMCKSLLSKEKPSIRELARVWGNFSASFVAVTFGKLHYRNLERDKIFALRKNG